MNEHAWKQLLSAYADDAVTPEERTQAEQLLRERPECRAYLDEIKSLSSALHTFKDQRLSPDAEQNMRSKITKERPMQTISWKPVSLVAVTVLVTFFLTQQYTRTSMLGSDGGLMTSTDEVSHQIAAAPHSTMSASRFNYKEADASASMTQPIPVSRPTPMPVAPPPTMRPIMPAGGPAQYAREMKSDMALAKAKPQGQWLMGQAAPASSIAGNMMDIKKDAMPAAGLAMRSMSVQSSNDYWGGSVNEAYVEYATPMPYYGYNAEEYAQFVEQGFVDVKANPLSTFSVDVDTSSYSNIRRFLSQGTLPPADAVRIEEMVNYFNYNYPKPKGNEPFSITTNMAVCPWNPEHQLVRIGLKGRMPTTTQLAASNLVFLIDVSGSMNSADKLPLVQQGLKMMVSRLRPQDRVSMVVYAGNAGLVLDSTPGDQKWVINNAIDSLSAGGSTGGGEGIALAYDIARRNFVQGGNNRVILATDGDFNVGITDTNQLVEMMKYQRRNGVFLTLLGVGQGNLKDNRMQQLADKGDGNYYYIDGELEAKKVLVDELGSTLYTIAKDVKIQVEFNPAVVQSYRLVGYEKRVLAKEDFNNDRKDAGEIGAGHTVTALYEVVPAGAPAEGRVDALKYQKNWAWPTWGGGEVMTVKLRYKEPQGNTSKLIARNIKKTDITDEPTGDFAWAASVAQYGMLLKGSSYAGNATYEDVLRLARNNFGADPDGLKAEFIQMVEQTRRLSPVRYNTNGGTIEYK